MKILQLNLFAFGPFTETLLDLSDGNHGLHILYGPNEAGKSSALRALRQMLYGIPQNSSDNFIHPYPKIRIGGKLILSDGRVLEFIRRKGRKNTLQTKSGTKVIEESQLRLFLGNADEHLFNTMFGIDHEGLEKGGKEIIQGGGEIGQILFAAGSGISDFRKIQDNLQLEADVLFRPKGIKQKINDAISTFKNTQKAIRDVQLSAQEWEAHENALNHAISEKGSLEKKLHQKLREKEHFRRIKEALPLIARWKELLNVHADYADAVLLQADFSEKRRDAVTRLRIAENEARQAKESLEQIQQSLNETDVAESLIIHADHINQLYKDLGKHQKAMEDRPRIMGRKTNLEAEANEILKGLGRDLTLEQAEQLRLEKAERVRIQQLSSDYEKLKHRQETTQAEIDKISLRINELNRKIAKLETPRNTAQLRKGIENARADGDLEAQYHAECAEIQKARNAAEIALKKLLLWKGTLEELEQLPVPSSETIDVFENRFQETWQVITKYRSEIESDEQELLNINGQIEQLQIEQEVPTENDLQEAREKRDQGWRLIRQESGSRRQASGVYDAYEQALRYADTLADRLRREADRVAKKASLLANREIRKTRLKDLKDRLEKAEAEFGEIKKEWVDVWKESGISPKSIREMRAWRNSQVMLADQVAKIREHEERAERLQSVIETHRRELNQCLRNIDESLLGDDESLKSLLNRSRQIAEHFEKIHTQQERLASELAQQEKDKKEAEKRAEKTEQALSQWRTDWKKAVQRLGLDADATPAQANAVIEEINSLFDKLKEANHDSMRIRGIDRDACQFTEKVRQLAKQTAQDLSEFPVEQVATELNARLTRALTEKTRQESLEQQKRQQEKQLQNAKKSIAEIQARLSVMCEEAGCKRYEELSEAEECSVQRVRIEKELSQINTELRKLSGGIIPEEFIQEVGEHDPDGIDPMIHQLAEEIEQLEKEKSALDQTIGKEQSELSRMDGSAKAAELAEEAQDILARMEGDVEQYARLRLASVMLSQAIERYREKNQEPILQRANELFTLMSSGSFEGLRPEFDEKGEAVLKGIRKGGKEIVSVEGMSDGTADQLYLSVRLASLEAYLEKNEPLPFIIDDILIKFDDERAIATLQVLAQLSQKTQVIFFTHHQHLVELAKKNIDDSVLFAHKLNSRHAVPSLFPSLV